LRPVAFWCSGFRDSLVFFVVAVVGAVAVVIDAVVKEEEDEESPAMRPADCKDFSSTMD